MWTEWLFQAEQGGSRLPDYMAPPVWNIQQIKNVYQQEKIRRFLIRNKRIFSI